MITELDAHQFSCIVNVSVRDLKSYRIEEDKILYWYYTDYYGMEIVEGVITIDDYELKLKDKWVMNNIIIIVTFVLVVQYVSLVIAIADDCLQYLGIKTK